MRIQAAKNSKALMKRKADDVAARELRHVTLMQERQEAELNAMRGERAELFAVPICIAIKLKSISAAVAQMRLERRASIVIQKCWKRHHDKKRLTKMEAAAVFIQKLVNFQGSYACLQYAWMLQRHKSSAVLSS